jgi:hypothetical protein
VDGDGDEETEGVWEYRGSAVVAPLVKGLTTPLPFLLRDPFPPPLLPPPPPPPLLLPPLVSLLPPPPPPPPNIHDIGARDFGTS